MWWGWRDSNPRPLECELLSQQEFSGKVAGQAIVLFYAQQQTGLSGRRRSDARHVVEQVIDRADYGRHAVLLIPRAAPVTTLSHVTKAVLPAPMLIP
jgi:hypothetical protein